jgi:phosphatidylglycerophosphate synthase
MTDALLIPFWNSCPTSHLRLLGVDFEDRIALQSHKLGFKRILSRFGSDEIRELPEQFLIFFPNILLSDGAWKRLKSLEPERETLTMANETNSFAVVRCGDAEFLLHAFQESESYPALLTSLKARLKREFVTLDERDWVAFRSNDDRRRVEAWLLRGLIKESEGFMSRHVERKISLAVTRSLVNTRLTPNAMTLVSAGIGILGAFFFAMSGTAHHVVGALLFWLHSVLDGCDGELARLKFAESRWGGLIDFWGDNVVHCAVFSAIAAGVHAKEPGPVPVMLAASAVSGTLLSAGLVHRTTMRGKISGGPLFTSVVGSSPLGENGSSPIEKIADHLARRDFIYLVIALAMAGKVKWFLRMGAIGAPLYFLALAALSLKNSPAARQQITSPKTL